MALHPATDDDYQAMFGLPAPGDWFGLVARTQWLIEGIGLVYRDIDDRWWIAFKRSPGVGKIKTAHVGASRILATAREFGIAIHAIPDPSIDGADRWLQRLGFERTDEAMGGLTVWARK